MYEQLYQYLLLNKQLPIPGIGTFLVERKPAETDFPNRTIHAPVYTIALQTGISVSSKKFYNWLAAALDISEHDAIRRFNDFVFDLKKQITSGSIVNWNGVGSLSNGLAGTIKFYPAEIVADEPVVAGKIMREKYEHTVRVGEDEKTSTQMAEMLNQPKKKPSIWWAYALVLALAAIIFICWYFSEHGLNVASASNAKKILPKEATATYRTLP